MCPCPPNFPAPDVTAPPPPLSPSEEVSAPLPSAPPPPLEMPVPLPPRPATAPPSISMAPPPPLQGQLPPRPPSTYQSAPVGALLLDGATPVPDPPLPPGMESSVVPERTMLSVPPAPPAPPLVTEPEPPAGIVITS